MNRVAWPHPPVLRVLRVVPRSSLGGSAPSRAAYRCPGAQGGRAAPVLDSLPMLGAWREPKRRPAGRGASAPLVGSRWRQAAALLGEVLGLGGGAISVPIRWAEVMDSVMHSGGSWDPQWLPDT